MRTKWLHLVFMFSLLRVNNFIQLQRSNIFSVVAQMGCVEGRMYVNLIPRSR